MFFQRRCLRRRLPPVAPAGDDAAAPQALRRAAAAARFDERASMRHPPRQMLKTAMFQPSEDFHFGCI